MYISTTVLTLIVVLLMAVIGGLLTVIIVLVAKDTMNQDIIKFYAEDEEHYNRVIEEMSERLRFYEDIETSIHYNVWTIDGECDINKYEIDFDVDYDDAIYGLDYACKHGRKIFSVEKERNMSMSTQEEVEYAMFVKEVKERTRSRYDVTKLNFVSDREKAELLEEDCEDDNEY